MANISEELSTIKNAIYGEDMRQAIYDALRKLSSESSISAMKFLSETVSINETSEYKLTAKDIAPSSPVYVSVKARTSVNDTIIRSDNEDLIDVLTGKVVDGTMTDIQVTAQDIIAGIKATNGMSVQIRYYNAKCEDLLQMIRNSGSGSDGYQIRFIPVVTDTYTLQESEGGIIVGSN